MSSPKLFPVLETLDLVYAYQYNWLRALAEATPAILIRPEPLVAKAFRMRIGIRDLLSYEYNVKCREIHEIRIMMDHGIFVEDFENIMGMPKTPENVVHMYDVLGIDYGLSYDLPAKLFLQSSVDIALSISCSGKRVRVPEKSIESIVHRISEELLTHVDECDKNLDNVRKRLQEALRDGMRKRDRRIYEYIHRLSEECVRETCKRFEAQVKALGSCKRFRVLMPVVQGLFKEHIDECIECELSVLVDNGYRDAYIAIGTGGRALSSDDKLRINYAIGRAHDVAKRLGIDIKMHLLGWTAPRNARGIDYSRIYSADALTARVRAGEGKIYVFSSDGVPRTVHVSKIDANRYSCSCPACRDEELRKLVLERSTMRKNDVRVVHNIWILSQFLKNNKGTLMRYIAK